MCQYNYLRDGMHKIRINKVVNINDSNMQDSSSPL